MKPREEFHSDLYRPSKRASRRDNLYFYGILILAVALWIPVIVLLTFGWGAVT